MKNSDLRPLSIDELARLLAVSSRTIRRLIDRGTLPPVRVGATLALQPHALPEPFAEAIQGGSGSPLLRLHEVADRLGCSPNRVRELAANGLLPPIRIGGSQRWSEDAVSALLQRGEVHGPR
jgi:excisionase family DNA binding protein